MPLKLWDFKCITCDFVFEDIVKGDILTTDCKKCGLEAERIFTPSGQYLGNQDADWIKTVIDVVDKDNNSPHVQEFIKNPTRDNYHRWMKKEGLRPLEIGGSQHGEDYYNKRAREEAEKNHVPHITEAVMKLRRERQRIEL